MFSDRAVPRFYLWVCLSGLGRAASAEAVANDLIERFPKYSTGYFAKAISLVTRGENDKARAVARRIDDLKLDQLACLNQWLVGRLANQIEDSLATSAAFEQAILDLNDIRDVEIFTVDARFRLALLRAAAPSKVVRNGVKAARLARDLVDDLDESPARRMALVVLACAEAEKGDFEEAIAAVDQAAEGEDVSAEETVRCKKLKQLFMKKSPYRLGVEDAADRLVEIPAVACYFGPLKKIDLNAEPTLTIPGK